MDKELQVRLVANKSVCEVESEALITAIDSSGIWCGQVDLAIRENVGSYYHQHLLGHITQKSGRAMFEDGQVLEVRGDEKNRAVFNNIIFVIDDTIRPLAEVVYAGLHKANEDRYRVVSMSCIRAGESFGRKEKSLEEMARQVYDGIRLFLNRAESIDLKRLLLITYDNDDYRSLLLDEFAKDEAVIAIY